jgi:hypothetical protein
MGPNQEFNNVEMKSGKNSESSKFSLKSKKVRIILASLLAVLVLGGAGAAAYVNSLYNKPENVLATAMANYLLDGKDKNFDAVINIGSEDPSSATANTELKMGVQTSGKTTQIDLEANVSVFRLRGAVQSNENGNIYVQVKDLPELLGSDAASAYGIPEEMKRQIAALEDKWIEITPEDLASLTVSSASTEPSTFDACTEALYSALDNKDLGDSVDKIYKGNRFFLAKSSSEEVVDGKKLLKVEVGLDQEKLKSFANEMYGVGEIKVLVEKCGLAGEQNVATEAKDSLKNGKMTVWLDRGKRELVKLEASGDNFVEEKKTGDFKMAMTVNAPAAKLDAPTDVVNIKELLQMFGIDPAALNQLSSGI